MAFALIPIEGEGEAITAFIRRAASVHLYVNNHTPNPRDTAGNFREASGHGYTAQTLHPNAWSRPHGDPLTASHPVVVFTFTGPARKMFGYYVITSDGKLLGAEAFPEATPERPFEDYVIVNPGDRIEIPMFVSAR